MHHNVSFIKRVPSTIDHEEGAWLQKKSNFDLTILQDQIYAEKKQLYQTLESTTWLSQIPENSKIT